MASDGQDSLVAPLNSWGPEEKSSEPAIPDEQTRTENSDKSGGQNFIVNSSGGPGDAAEATASNNALEAIVAGKITKRSVRRGMILPHHNTRGRTHIEGHSARKSAAVCAPYRSIWGLGRRAKENFENHLILHSSRFQCYHYDNTISIVDLEAH